MRYASLQRLTYADTREGSKECSQRCIHTISPTYNASSMAIE